jgi:hypothetical protein
MRGDPWRKPTNDRDRKPGKNSAAAFCSVQVSVFVRVFLEASKFFLFLIFSSTVYQKSLETLAVRGGRSYSTRPTPFFSVADPGSGAFLTPGPGSGIGLSRIPNPYF